MTYFVKKSQHGINLKYWYTNEKNNVGILMLWVCILKNFTVDFTTGHFSYVQRILKLKTISTVYFLV